MQNDFNSTFLVFQFSCCGVNNYTDYYNDAYPVSCCAPAADVVIKDLVDQLWSADTTTYELANSDCPINVTHVEATPVCFQRLYPCTVQLLSCTCQCEVYLGHLVTCD